MISKVSFSHIVLVALAAVLLAAQPAAVLGQEKPPPKTETQGQGTAHVGSNVPVIQCVWKPELVVVSDPRGDDKKKEKLDKALKALVKALGAAADEVSAVKKAIDEIGPGRDQPDVKVVCACIGAGNKVMKRKEVPIPGNDEWLWSAKQNFNKDRAELAKQRGRAEGDACRH